jgi:predicted GNAT family N-acyltransferase
MQRLSVVNYQIITNANDLQKCFSVRSIVFCEEQNCPYSEEIDGFDFSSIHFLATIDGEPIATARMRLFADYVKIERLAVRKAYRGKGIGKDMFAFVLNHINELGYKKIKLHAQAYLVKFYEDFGFTKHGEKFLEVNIEHYAMEKEIK